MQAANRFFRRGTEMATAKKREELVFQLMSQFCQALLGSAEFRIVN
jgi:hypothetical protein